MNSLRKERTPMQPRGGKLAEKLSRVIASRIEEEVWPRGTRLPSEVDLAREFGVSRPVIREALAKLRADGMVESRRGAGTHVLSEGAGNTGTTLPTIGTISDLIRHYEFRMAIEGKAARFAAERASAADCDALKIAVEDLRRSDASSSGAEPDFRFHLGVAVASHNPFFVAVMTLLEASSKFGMRLVGKLSQMRAQDEIEMAFREHAAVLEAICARNADQAERTMLEHIDAVRRRLIGDGLEQNPFV